MTKPNYLWSDQNGMWQVVTTDHIGQARDFALHADDAEIDAMIAQAEAWIGTGMLLCQMEAVLTDDPLSVYLGPFTTYYWINYYIYTKEKERRHDLGQWHT